MLSDTLTEGLENYRIGPKIRDLRTEKGLGLTQLGEHTGLSAGMLSKIERGQVFPTLPTLLRVAMVFGVGLEHFFADPTAGPVVEVVRAKDRLRLPNVPKGPPSFFFESLDFPVHNGKLTGYKAEFLPDRDAAEPHAHPGPELIYVLSGVLELTVRDKRHRLETGDSVYFDPEFDHSYRCGGELACCAIVIVAQDQAS